MPTPPPDGGGCACSITTNHSPLPVSPALCRRRQKENQEDLLARVNQATLNMLNKNSGDGRGPAGASGKRVSETVAYKSVTEMQQYHSLTVQVFGVLHCRGGVGCCSLFGGDG